MRRGIWLFILLSSVASASGLHNRLQAYLNTIPKDIHAALMVQSLDQGQLLFSQYPDHTLVPASTLKLALSLAALHVLGPNWHWQTTLWQTGRIEAGVLKGDVWLVLQGDPELTLLDVQGLFAKLKAQGIHRIDGHVWLDINAYDRDFRVPGWAWEDVLEGYAVPVSAGIIDRNQLWVDIQPQGRNQADMALRPAFAGQLQAHVHWQPFVQPKPKGCDFLKKGFVHNRYTFSGCGMVPESKHSIELAVWDLPFYLEQSVLQALVQAHIAVQTVQIAAQAQRRPEQAVMVASHASRSLRDLVVHMLKESDNLIAQTLFKQIAYQQGMQAVSWQVASQAMNRALVQYDGIVLPAIDDGAGASMYNRLSVRQQLEVLSALCKHFDLCQQPHLWLSVLGVDGTLEGRLQNHPVKGHFYGKTGTMSGVSSLVGILEDKKSKRWLVAMMQQGNVGQRKTLRAIEDDVLQLLYQ